MNVTETKKCGWCKKQLQAKRRKISPIGPECDSNLPDVVNVAILNISHHGEGYYNPPDAGYIAQQAMESHFGSEIDLIITVETGLWDSFDEHNYEAFWNDNGILRIVNSIHPGYLDEPIDEGGNFYSEEELLWKRRVAMMLDSRTKTKFCVKHIDASWIDFVNIGHYAGPIPSTMTVEQFAKERSYFYPIKLNQDGECEELDDLCDLQSKLNDFKSRLLEKPCFLVEHILNLSVESICNEIETMSSYMNDIEKHPHFTHGSHGFLGNFEYFGVSKCYDKCEPHMANLVSIDGLHSGYWLQLEQDKAQKILNNNILPVFLRGIRDGFDENWNWVTGKAKINPPIEDWMVDVMTTDENTEGILDSKGHFNPLGFAPLH